MRFSSKTFRRRLSKSKSKSKSKKHTLRNRRVKRSKRAVTKKHRQHSLHRQHRQNGGTIPEHAVLANPLNSDAAGQPDSDAQ